MMMQHETTTHNVNALRGPTQYAAQMGHSAGAATAAEQQPSHLSTGSNQNEAVLRWLRQTGQHSSPDQGLGLGGSQGPQEWPEASDDMLVDTHHDDVRYTAASPENRRHGATHFAPSQSTPGQDDVHSTVMCV